MRPWIFLLVGLSGCHVQATASPKAPNPRYMHYDTGKDTPKGPEEQIEVGRAAAYMEARPSMHALIVGHTDAEGDAQRNKALSFRRARGVHDALVGQGIASSRLVVAARGEAQPSGSNDTEEGRAKNRRVEVFFFYPERGDAQQQYGAKIEIHVR